MSLTLLPLDVVTLIVQQIPAPSQVLAIATLRLLSKGMKNKMEKLEVNVNVPHIPPKAQIATDEQKVRPEAFRNVIRCFPRMKSLRVLTTGRSLTKEDFVGIENMHNLRSVKLCSLRHIGDEVVVPFARLPSLRRITLNSLYGITKLSLRTIADSNTIESITLIHQYQLDDEILMRIAKMPGLKSLSIVNCGSAGKPKADGSKNAAIQALEIAGVEVRLGNSFVSFAVSEIARRKREKQPDTTTAGLQAITINM